MSASSPPSSKAISSTAKLGALGLTAAASIGGIQSAAAQTVFSFTPTSNNTATYSSTQTSTINVDLATGTTSTTDSTGANFALQIDAGSVPTNGGKALVSSPTGLQNESVVSTSTSGGTSKPVVTPLSSGTAISSGSSFNTLNGGLYANLSSTDTGFPENANGYFGFSFTNGANTDYGWMNITTTNSGVNSNGPDTLTLNSFAYEDGGSGIVAGGGALSAVPEPADTAAIMGGMALVAGSVMMYRRRHERAGATFAA